MLFNFSAKITNYYCRDYNEIISSGAIKGGTDFTGNQLILVKQLLFYQLSSIGV